MRIYLLLLKGIFMQRYETFFKHQHLVVKCEDPIEILWVFYTGTENFGDVIIEFKLKCENGIDYIFSIEMKDAYKHAICDCIWVTLFVNKDKAIIANCNKVCYTNVKAGLAS